MMFILEQRVELGLCVLCVLIRKMVCCLCSLNSLFEFPLKLYLKERMKRFKACVSTYSKDQENTVLLSWAGV